MLSNIGLTQPADSSLGKAAISMEGTGLFTPWLAERFETHLSNIIANSGLLLKTTVANRVAMVRPAYDRDRKTLGRVFNQLFRVNSKFIELSGIELLAVIKLTQETFEGTISPNGTYRVPIEEAERILMKLRC